jgi:hypothetical protein
MNPQLGVVTMIDDPKMAVAFDAVKAAEARLPDCDRAVRLHALVDRVSRSSSEGLALDDSTEQLVAAALAALADDPWVQFEHAVRRLRAAVTESPVPVTPVAC